MTVVTVRSKSWTVKAKVPLAVPLQVTFVVAVPAILIVDGDGGVKTSATVKHPPESITWKK